MIKRTLYFGNPAYLKTANEQLIVEMHDSGETKPMPIEDIGILILDNAQITITQVLMAKLLANNTALITCDHTHHPVGLLLNLDGNNLQSQKFKEQIDASVPLKKQLWQQTVAQKIYNQAMVLKSQRAENKLLLNLSTSTQPAAHKIPCQLVNLLTNQLTTACPTTIWFPRYPAHPV